MEVAICSLFLISEKIYSYLVSFSTVVILFAIAFTVTTDSSIITSATARELPIYNVDTKENKISLTMICAWNADDIDSILKTLKRQQCKNNFFMVGDWVDKFPEAVKKDFRCWPRSLYSLSKICKSCTNTMELRFCRLYRNYRR